MGKGIVFYYRVVSIVYMAFGPNRIRRKMIDVSVLECIATFSTLGNQLFDTR